MTTSTGSGRGRVVAVIALCLILGAAPTLATPASRQSDEGIHWRITDAPRQIADTWLGFLKPGSVGGEPSDIHSASHGKPSDDMGPIGDTEEETATPPEYMDPPSG